jgi:hypothetical protein
MAYLRERPSTVIVLKKRPVAAGAVSDRLQPAKRSNARRRGIFI